MTFGSVALSRIAAPVAGAALALLLAAPASAAVIVKDPVPANPFSLLHTDVEFPPSVALTFDKFDPSLGTLQNVTFLLSSEFFAQISVEIEDGDAGTSLEALGQLTFSVTAPGVAIAEVAVVDAFCFEESGFCSSDGTPVTGLFERDALDGDNQVGAGDLALYVGPGSFVADLSIVGEIIDVLCGGFASVCDVSQLTGDWLGALQVQYTYEGRVVTDVPVPASLAMFGAGLLGLVGLRRRAAA